jgi:hypothetical protein
MSTENYERYRGRREVADQIAWSFTARAADDYYGAARFDELSHTFESPFGIDVVKYCHGHDRVKRLGFERILERVPADVIDVVARLLSSCSNTALIRVDTHNVGVTTPQSSSEHPLPAPEVQDGLGAGLHRLVGQPVIVGVVVPPIRIGGRLGIPGLQVDYRIR